MPALKSLQAECRRAAEHERFQGSILSGCCQIREMCRLYKVVMDAPLLSHIFIVFAYSSVFNSDIFFNSDAFK